MQIVTRKHLGEFLQEVGKIAHKVTEIRNMGLCSLAVVQHNTDEDNLDGARAFGLQATLVLEAEMEDMFTRIEKPAFKLLGETRKPIETAKGFFERITAMDESQMLAAMRRNGCVWKAS